MMPSIQVMSFDCLVDIIIDFNAPTHRFHGRKFHGGFRSFELAIFKYGLCTIFKFVARLYSSISIDVCSKLLSSPCF